MNPAATFASPSRAVFRPKVVGILGGMGPAAGADFARHFVAACAVRIRVLNLPVTDQNFPEHWLAQVPVPDRTRALLDSAPGEHQPLEVMLQAVGRLSALGATTVALACNTAHAWHGRLQARFPHIEILHVACEVARMLAGQGVTRCGLLATDGTYHARLYDAALAEAGIECHFPQDSERARLMRGIYDGVKAGNLALARDAFASVAAALADRHELPVMILGCTEIPLALDSMPGGSSLRLIDPTAVLAHALARRAYAMAARAEDEPWQAG
jgi:aspartate racemase